MSGQPDLFFDRKTDFLEEENILHLFSEAKCKITMSPWQEVAVGIRGRCYVLLQDFCDTVINISCCFTNLW